MVKHISFQFSCLVLLSASLFGVEAVKPKATSTPAASSASSASSVSSVSSQQKAAAGAKTAVSVVEKITKPVPLHKTYAYQADRYRDPFVPLIGAESRTDTNERAPQIAALSLKGIIQDSKGRMAVLTSGVSSYILKGGRLYDAHNKLVKGISGVVKTSSVMLIGSDRTVKEIRLVKPVTP